MSDYPMLWRTHLLRYTLGYKSDISPAGNDLAGCR